MYTVNNVSTHLLSYYYLLKFIRRLLSRAVISFFQPRRDSIPHDREQLASYRFSSNNSPNFTFSHAIHTTIPGREEEEEEEQF